MELYGAIYIKEKKLLLCKNDFYEKITIPLKKSDYQKFETMLKKEFGIFPFLTKIYNNYEIPLINNDEYIIENVIPFKIEEYPEYTLKEIPTIDETGEYTLKEYYNYNEIVDLYKNNIISEKTFLIALDLYLKGEIE